MPRRAMRDAMRWGWGLAAALVASSATAQSLDDAVAGQLEPATGTTYCTRLLDGDPVTVLEGGLFQICNRGAGQSSGSSNASGGGAATPATLPAAVEKRLAREGEHPDVEQATRGERAEAATDLGAGVGVFLSAEYEDLQRDRKEFEDGYDSQLLRLTFGADRRFGERFVAGLAVDGVFQEGDFDGGGDFENERLGVLGFAAFRPVEIVSIEAVAGYDHTWFDRARIANFTQPDGLGGVDFTRTARTSSDFEADGAHVGGLLVLDLPLQNATLSPQAGLDYRYLGFESYRERGSSGLELAFRSDDQEWLQSRVGAVATVSLSAPFGVIVPQVGLEWKHEFMNDQRRVEASFTGDPRAKTFRFETEEPDRDFFVPSVGLVAVLPGGIQVFASYRALLGHSHFEGHAGTVGIRGEL